MLGGCNKRERPATFIESNPNWINVKVSQKQTRDSIWINLTDLLAKRYDLEIINRDIGYIRTAWKCEVDFSVSGKVVNEYRKRVIVKINSDSSNVELKAEAQWWNTKFWVNGYDSTDLNTVKTDISAIISDIAK